MPSEQVWMGKERKRGKLADLNNLLRGNNQTNFFIRSSDVLIYLLTIKYVITLDSDTQLPRESARQFVGDYGSSTESATFRCSQYNA